MVWLKRMYVQWTALGEKKGKKTKKIIKLPKCKPQLKKAAKSVVTKKTKLKVEEEELDEIINEIALR
jgi:hypothetical protein